MPLDLNEVAVAAGKDGDDGHRLIDVYKLGRNTRKLIVQRALATHDNDQELFMTKLKARMDACALHLTLLSTVLAHPYGRLRVSLLETRRIGNTLLDIQAAYRAEVANSIYRKRCVSLQCGHQTLHGGGPL